MVGHQRAKETPNFRPTKSIPMLAILREISVTCFFTSYLVVLVLDLLRLFGRIPGRGLAVLLMMSVGLATHVTYLVLRASGQDGDVGRLANWTDWSLLLALGLAASFFIFYLRRPDTIISFFFLPMILVLIGIAVAMKDQPSFDRSEAVVVWRMIHALAMVVGTGAVFVGFLSGIMYLVQSWRLKRKRAGSALRLPTLETLQRLNRHCLVTSTAAVTVGLVAGVVMNLNSTGQMTWTDRGIVFSALLLIWLVIATIVEFAYQPAQHGRKVAYLTLASFVFLIVAMIGVIQSSHGQGPKQTKASPTETASVRIDRSIGGVR